MFQKEHLRKAIILPIIIVCTTMFLAEEIGWRGYLEPLLIQSGIHKRLVPCIVESYIYSFLMRATSNNIISAMTYHFVWNLIIHIAAVNPVDNNGNIFPYVILVVLEALVLPVVMLLI